MAPPKQTRVIDIKVISTGDGTLRKISSEMGKLNRNVKRASQGLGRLQNAFRGFIAAFGVREIAKAADEFQLLEDRIAVFTGSSEKARDVFGQIRAAAAATRTSVASLGEIYNRVALSTEELGLSSEQVVAVTTALQQTFRLSGSTIAESTASTIQLTQGLSAGALRGQELRSVLESNAVFAGILSEELNVARGDLIKFAETGGITSERVLQALAKNFDEINKKAGQLRITFEQAATLGLDRLKQAVNELNQEFGIASKFAKGVEFTVDNLKELFGIIAGFVASKALVRLGEQLQTFTLASASAKFLSSANALTAALVGLGFAAAKANKASNEALASETLLQRSTRLTKEIKTQSELIANIRKLPNTGEFIGSDEQIKKGEKNLTLLRRQLKETRQLLDQGLTVDPKTFKGSPTDILKNAAADLDKATLNFEKGVPTLKELNTLFIANRISVEEYDKALNKLQIDKLNESFKKGTIDRKDLVKGLKKLADELNKSEVTKTLTDINAEFRKTGDVDKYNKALLRLDTDQLNDSFDRGEIRLTKLNKGLKKLADEIRKNKLGLTLKQLNQQFSLTGDIDSYNESIRAINLEKLNQDFREGIITVDQYRQGLIELKGEAFNLESAFLGVQDGLNRVARDAGNVAKQVSNGIQQAFSRLEDSIVEFTKTGRFEFSKFTQDILSDINRIIIRAAIIGPLANALGRGLFSASAGSPQTIQNNVGPSAPSNTAFAANGMALRGGNIIPFATGGIVTGPTLFPLNGGRTGVMGEAGAEAIVPLRRGRGGRLGVDASGASNVQVNVINNTGSDVDTQERISSDGSKILDIVIGNTVRDGLANGEFDQSFGEIFGLQRQGR
jgi:lambda family phage tail tape measure protein